MFDDFAKVNNDMLWLSQQDDHTLHGGRSLRLAILEDLLEDYVCEGKVDLEFGTC